MGEYADMIIDGLIDGTCGQVIDGESPGHPRTMKDALPVNERGKNFLCPSCGKGFLSEQAVRDHKRSKGDH